MTTIDAVGNLHDNAGRFSQKENSAPASLGTTTDARDWGSTGVREGSRTPWGSADWVEQFGPGVTSVSTAGHGGLKLSTERNAVIPPALRNANGWYEEDCEVAIVGMFHPDLPWSRTSSAESFEERVKEWFPDQWEAATGGQIQPGESNKRDRAVFLAEHAGDFVATSAISSESDDSMVLVSARRADDGAEEQFLVPREEYKARRAGDMPFLVDPSRHPKLPPAPQPEPARNLRRTERIRTDRISGSAISQAYIDGVLTAAARDRVSSELDGRWQERDGRISTLRQIIERDPVFVSAHEEHGRLSYRVVQESDSGSRQVMKVSKATFDFLTAAGAVDDRPASHRLQQEANVARARADQLHRTAYTAEERRKADVARAKAMGLDDAARIARHEEQERDIAENGTFAEREARRKQAQRDRELAATIAS